MGMFRAAFPSRSWSLQQEGQSHCRLEGGICRCGSHTPGRSGRWLPAGDNLNNSAIHLGLDARSVQSRGQPASAGAGLAVLHHPRDVHVLGTQHPVCRDESRAEPVEMIQPLIRHLGVGQGPSEPHRGAVVRAPGLAARLRCSLGIRFRAVRRNTSAWAIFSPSLVTARDARPGSTPTVLPLGSSWGHPTAITKLATDRPAQSLMMVTLLGAADRGLLQAMGMLPTLVSRSFPPSTPRALGWNRMLCRLLRRLNCRGRTLSVLFHQLRRA